ncbi:MAG: PSD1 and planctomycete cytochrome C domain-containing protein [Planctomycetales bacterium]|nr:PSD1 and planctomycete cytochrome C domain-containing protein [Planctomycetales bacterium]
MSIKPVAPEMANDEFFERKVRPLLIQNCFACHAKGQKKGGLSLADRAGLLAGGDSGAVVALEKPQDSLLIAAVEHRGGVAMPPDAKLSGPEIAILKKWIELGAPWPESANKGNGIRTSGSITDEDRQFWSFQPVKDVAPPAVKNGAWSRRPLDQFVLAQLEANGLSPVGEADKRTFIRRATFDLIGLPPTPDDVAAFVADDSPLAHERLINRLLESPHYGERWARHWLDVARYGEDQAHTFQARMYPSGYRYRDWVVTALNADMPYNQFVIEQIAGDLLPDDAHASSLSGTALAAGQSNAVVTEPAASAVPLTSRRLERLPALGYLALGPVYYKDAGCAGKAESDEVDDRIDTLCRGFLGLTVSCARCHDHKFDPIPTQDYYALAGVFASTEYREAPLAPDDIVKQFDAKAEAIKSLEKKLADTQTDEARKLGESLVPNISKYVIAAWKLQEARRTDPKISAKSFTDEGRLHEFLIDRWSQFLTSDLVQKRAYFNTYKSFTSSSAEKPGVNDTTAESPPDADAVVSIEAKVEWFGVALQQQISTAIRTRVELEAAYAKQLAAAADADKNKVAKPKFDGPMAELLKDILTANNAPLFIPKGNAEKLYPEASKVLLGGIQQELDQSKKELGPKYPTAHSLAEAKPTNVKVNLRGNHKELGDEVPRRFLAILSPAEPQPFRDGSGRLELARAIADPANPLTARVMVNRVWQHHFGRGLVGTPSNFGLLGERPTHPELLDHLAAKFVASSWSLKQLHREIMLSATYRLSSQVDGRGLRVEGQQQLADIPISSPSTLNPQLPTTLDPDNRLLWRHNRRRLDIEAWRDSMLAVSGNLDRALGGAAVNLNDGGNRRRTLYAAISRHELNGTLRLFDFPDPNLTSERRVSTTVPMQQLFVLNSDFLVRQARSLSQRLSNEATSDDKGRIERAYSILFQRPPNEAEVRIGLSYLQAPLPENIPADQVKLTAWEQYTQALLGTNEFVFVD